jgi:hypothetical protein
MTPLTSNPALFTLIDFSVEQKNLFPCTCCILKNSIFCLLANQVKREGSDDSRTEQPVQRLQVALPPLNLLCERLIASPGDYIECVSGGIVNVLGGSMDYSE